VRQSAPPSTAASQAVMELLSVRKADFLLNVTLVSFSETIEPTQRATGSLAFQAVGSEPAAATADSMSDIEWRVSSLAISP
jgi:hypothetical protein